MSKRFILICGFAFVVGCAGNQTTLINTWTEPSTKQLHFEKIAVVVATSNVEIRKEAEDQLASLIKKASPSYPFVTAEHLKDWNTTRAAVQAAGYDGMVLMRLIEISEHTDYVPTTPSTPSRYDAYDWDQMAIPVKQKVAVIESRIYSVADDKLLWAGRSRTIEPGTVHQTLPEVVEAVRDRLKKDGLIPR